MAELEVRTRLPHERRGELVDLARAHLAGGANPPTSLIYVVPTRRFARHVERELAREGSLIPLIGTPSDVAAALLAKAEPGTALLPADIQRLAVLRALEDEWGDLPYLSRGREAEGPSVGMAGQLFLIIRNARERRVDLARELARSPPGSRDADIARVCAAYVRLLDGAGATDAAGAMERLVSMGQAPLSDIGLVLEDTLPPEPTPVEELFLEWLREGVPQAFVRRVRCPGMDKVFRGEARAADGQGDGTIAGELCAAMFCGPTTGQRRDMRDRIALISGEERSGELEAVAEEVRRLLDGDVQPSSISVVFPQTEAYYAQLVSVFSRWGIPFDTPGHESLAGSGPGRTALAALDAALGGIPRQALADLASSPYVGFVDGRGTPLDGAFVREVASRSAFRTGADEWRRALGRARERRERAAGLPDLPPAARRALEERAEHARRQEACAAELIALLQGLAPEGPLAPREFARRLVDAVARLGIRERALSGGPDISAPDAAALRRLDSAIAALGRMADVLGDAPQDAGRLQAAFHVIASGSRFGARPRRADAVQAMSMLEAQGLGNDHVFVCGLSEEDVPGRRRAEGLLPDDEDVRGRLSDDGRELVLQRYLFLMAASSARARLFLSRPSTLGEKRVIPSIFLDELGRRFELGGAAGGGRPRSARDRLVAAGRALASPGGALPRGELIRLPRQLRLRAARAARAERVLRSPGAEGPLTGHLADGEARALVAGWLDGRAFSASEVELYSKCPFSFMARYLLRLREDDEPSAQVRPKDAGNLVHLSLCLFLARCRDKGLLPLSAARMPEQRALIEECVTEAAAMLGGEGVSWEVLPRSLLADGGALSRWLAAESAAWRPFPGFEPTHLELAVGPAPGERDGASQGEPVEVDIGGERLRFTAKMDRVDADGAGNFVLYDYKTSADRKEGPTAMEKGYSVQLALYPRVLSAAAQRAPGTLPGGPAAAAAFYKVSPAAQLERWYLCSRDRLEGLKGRISAIGDEPVKRVMTCQRHRQDVPLEDMQASVDAAILAAVGGMRECRFPAPDDPPDGCEYCVARHACRSPGARVARRR